MRLLAALTLVVSGNHLVNGAGKTVRLLGVDRSGLEYACVQGWGFSDGPTDAASIAAMRAWRINAVRVPLNEDCWLGINGVKPQYGGARVPRVRRGLRAAAQRGRAHRDPRPALERARRAAGHRAAADAGRRPLARLLALRRAGVPHESQRRLRPLQRAARRHVELLAQRLRTVGGHAAARRRRAVDRRAPAAHARRPRLVERPLRLAALAPARPAAPARRVVPPLQLQHVRHRGLLAEHGRTCRQGRSRRHRRARRERLRARLHRHVHAVGRRARDLVPRVDVGHVGLQQRPGADQRATTERRRRSATASGRIWHHCTAARTAAS